MTSDRQYGWMWLQACELLDRAERMQRQFLRYLGPGAGTAEWEPPVDIEESSEGVLLVFALPGVAPEDIEVRLEAGSLTVDALRRVRLTRRDARIRRLEIPHGRVRRRIALASSRLEVAGSRYVNGCLEVRLARPTAQERK